MISCSLSPNTEADDVWLALKTMLMPWTHHHGNAVDQVEQWFCRYFPYRKRFHLIAPDLHCLGY